MVRYSSVTLDMRSYARHISLAFAAVTIAAAAASAQPADNGGEAAFTVFLRGSRIGSQSIEVSRTPSGWLISAVGRLDRPVDLATTRFELTYDADWQPQRLEIEAQLRGEPFLLTTTFAGGTARSEVTQSGQSASRAANVSARAIVLPNSFFGAYAALARRLEGAAVGASFPVFAAPDTEASAVVERISPRRIVTPDGAVEVQDYVVTIASSSGPVPLELWVDANHRLARVVLPAAAIAVVRDDLASVMTREEPVHNPGDETVYIPANGFSLAATLTVPSGVSGKTAAVVLVGTPGPQGREHLSYGIPIFGQLAGRLAEAGYVAVRYDARGVGQTGGRIESAGLVEYAEDAIAVVKWLRKRSDVDGNRVVLVGYGDGGPVALQAAMREKDIKGVALLASPGRNGRDVTLEQQERMLATLPISDAAKQQKIDLQTRVMDAVMTGRGWEGLPADLRPEFDSVWFRTWLQFSPAEALKKVGQPLLILHGAVDTETPGEHADVLEALAGARKTPAAYTQKVVIPGVNRLLVSAPTGDVDEYGSLTTREVAPEVSHALVSWLAGIGRTR